MTTITVYKRALRLLGAERGLTILLSLAGMALAAVQTVEPKLFGWVVDSLSKGQEAYSYIALWAGLGIFGILAGTVVAVLADRLAHRRRLAALSNAFERAITLPVSYHAERGSGAVVRSILAGTDALFWLWLLFLREQLTAIVGIVLIIPLALSTDVRMTGILLTLGVLYLALNLLVVRKTSDGQAAIESYHNNVFGRVGDVIGNVNVVQSFTRLGAEMQAMRAIMDDLLTAQYPVLTWWGLLTVLTRAAGTITMVLIFGYGALLVGKGEITVGAIVSFVFFAQILISKLDQLSNFIVRIHQQAPTMGTYFELLDTASVVTEKKGVHELAQCEGRVVYEDVSFRFNDSQQGIFHISFAARPGETIALVGPTGSGKTTTLALLQRMRQPDAGRILVDNEDITDISISSLRRHIGVVFQDAGLFNRSILENIRVGKPDATQEEVERAARLAEAHDFILRKKGGYQFVIGERGASLSGGERQRIAVARAILKNAPILILDEATSALDAETEAKIKRALDALRKGHTTFIIAHRLSTVADADQILVLEDGRIVEQGTFGELVAQKGLFARLVAEGGFTEPVAAETETFPAAG